MKHFYSVEHFSLSCMVLKGLCNVILISQKENMLVLLHTANSCNYNFICLSFAVL